MQPDYHQDGGRTLTRETSIREQLQAEASRIREGRLFEMTIVDYQGDIHAITDEMQALDLADTCAMWILPGAEGSWQVLIARDGRMPITVREEVGTSVTLVQAGTVDGFPRPGD